MGIKAILHKEMLEGIRNYRFLILLSGCLFFAILDPVMSKFFLPEILGSQFPNMPSEVLQGMLDTTQTGNMRTYLGNLFQLGTLVVAFALSGLTAQELSDKTLVFPVCSGKRFEWLLLGKLMVYGPYLLLVTTVSTMINYVYTGVLFGFELPSVMPALRAGLLYGGWMAYILALLLVVGVLVKKPVGVGVVVLILAFGTRIVGNLFKADRWLPSGLVVEADLLAAVPTGMWGGALITTVALVSILTLLTVLRLEKMELMGG